MFFSIKKEMLGLGILILMLLAGCSFHKSDSSLKVDAKKSVIGAMTHCLQGAGQ